jgi:hypothetical protein
VQTAAGAASTSSARSDPLAAGGPAGGSGPDEEAEPPGADARRSRLVLLLLLALLAIPLVTAAVGLREPRWFPTIDDAQTELRVRDVWGPNPPQTGLGGRIGDVGLEQGSHPGPLSFWSLSVFYRLFGASSWALNVATASLHLIAMGATLWLARRRGGMALLLGVAVTVAALAHAFGGHALTSPWNPYLPVLWWIVFVMGVWSLLCGDLRVLPLAVFAGSFCVQTHISYVGLVAAVGGIGALSVGAWIFRRRADAVARRDAITFAALGAVLGIVLWSPPLAEQVTGAQGGNLAIIADHFADPPEAPLGLRTAVDYLLVSMNPWHLLTEPVIEGRPFLAGTPTLPGTLLLAAWAASAAVTWRRGHRTLLRLHLLLALALVAGLVSVSRIFGPPWNYLTLWAWGLGAMVTLAVAWSVCSLLSDMVAARTRRPLAVAGAVGLVAATALLALGLTSDSTDLQPFPPEVSRASAVLVPDVIAALEGSDRGDQRYLVTWNDARHQGAYGFVLFNELERAGFDVGAPEITRIAVTRHRVRTPGEATAHIHLSSGSDIGIWRAKPAFEEIAAHAPFGAEGLAELEGLKAEVVAELEAAGRPELIGLIDENPGGFGLQTGFSDELYDRIDRIIELDVPIAVFSGPPEG